MGYIASHWLFNAQTLIIDVTFYDCLQPLLFYKLIDGRLGEGLKACGL